MARVQDNHGGGCCGVYHVLGFYRAEEKESLEVVKLKTRFKNRNSGNYCNVLHWSPTNELHGSPYWKKESK